ncbi:bacterial Ig-like domain-containing protein, partial [Paenibacillus albiflavus]|uniref:bacterial Ig-like domain-containing protein n=1 Tax=Paenibacillus albiflavus TaxID=2545760 RepID=UPI001A9E3BCC
MNAHNIPTLTEDTLKDGKNIEIITNKFSMFNTYALVYKDPKKTEQAAPTGITGIHATKLLTMTDVQSQGALSGTTTAMEYRAYGSDVWIDAKQENIEIADSLQDGEFKNISSTGTKVDPTGAYYVRYKETQTKDASLEAGPFYVLQALGNTDNDHKNYLTDINRKMAYAPKSSIDIIGYANGKWVSSSYNDYGFTTVVGEEKDRLNDLTSTTGVDKNNINYKLIPEFIDKGTLLKLNYEVQNNSTEEFSTKFGAFTDIKVNDDDFAPVKHLNDHKGFTTTGDGVTFTLFAKDLYETNANTYWFGSYGGMINNLYVQYDGEDITGVDSGIAYSFNVDHLEMGAKTTKSVVMGIVQEIIAELVSIHVTTPPTKIIYNVGENLDLTGLVVTGTYDDKTTAIMNVTLADITGFDKTKVGKQTLTVTIDGKTTTFEVTVEKKLVSIKVTTPPTKMIYNVGESLDPTGLVVTGTYDDDTTAIMNVTLTDITGFDKTKLGKQTLTVTIDGKSTTFEVTVEKKLVSIKVTTPPTKIIYNVGESLDPTGLVVTGTYDDDTTAIMNVTLTDITGFDKTKLGKQTLTVTIDGKSTTFEVTVEKKLVSIKVTTPPTKIIYNVGESLDPTGLVVTGTYDDDTTAIMNVTLTDITGFDKTKLGKQTLTVTIDGKSTTFEVTVEKKLVSIKVTTPPTKIIYNVGESLDPTGLVVTGTYDDDTTAIMNVTLTDITGFDKTKLGKQTLTVTIDGKSTTFEVTVEKKLVSIKVTTPPTKIIYNVGESLDPTGLVVTGTYDDDTTAIMNVTLTDITGFDKTKLGKQTLTVTIDGKSTTFEVTVEKKLVSIKVTTPPTKIIYNVGESLDPTGLVVTGTYDDDTTAIMNVTLTDITGFDKTKLGKQTLTVTIDGKSTTFEVTVEKKLVSIKVTTPPTKIIY